VQAAYNGGILMLIEVCTSKQATHRIWYQFILLLIVATLSIGLVGCSGLVSGGTKTPSPSDTTPPTVSITSPAAGATLSGTVNLTANASDDVAVASVQFKVDGGNVGALVTSAPYTVSFNTKTLSDGNHTITAVAADTSGNTATSAGVQVKISNSTSTPPTVSIPSPANGATVSAMVVVTASASSSIGVASVQFQLDGANLGSAVTAAPYTFSWDTTKTSNGAHALTAIAKDTAGSSTTSAGITVTVNNQTTPPPTVSITSPANGATVSATVVVTASASSSIGVASVQFQLDGANLGSAVTAAPYTFSWDTTKTSNGTHTLTAIAKDTAGTSATSAGVTAVVSNSSPPPGTVNGFLNRSTGVNVPGGASSIVSSNNFSAINPPQTGTPPIDTWTAGTRDDFYIYKPGSVSKDCSVTAENISNVCSLKYTLQPGYSVGDPGWYIWNFKTPGDATGLFGNGQEFYVQYQERIDNMASPGAYTGTQGNGFKLDLITEADSPTFNSHNCTNSPAQLTVIQDDVNAPFPGAFINCGFSGAAYAFGQSGYEAFQVPISGNYLDQVASGCEHYTDAGHTQYPVGDPTCWNFVNSEWFTVQVHYKIGAFNSPNSVADIWFAHNGQPARLVQQAADAYIPNDNTGPINKYGRIVLLPYNTSSTANVSGAFYYGDLIVSTRRIPDPLVSTPNAPDSLSLSVATGRITVNWRVNSQNGTAQDDTGFLVERCAGTVATCFPSPQSGFTQIGMTPVGALSYQDNTVSAGTTYTYRVRAKNSAGDSSYAAAICFNGGTTCGGTAVAQ
jgi:hypothetical protein